jgi:hypothetical protein
MIKLTAAHVSSVPSGIKLRNDGGPSKDYGPNNKWPSETRIIAVQQVLVTRPGTKPMAEASETDVLDTYRNWRWGHV